MTRFNDAFVDIEDFQPPKKWQARFSNLLVWLMVVLLLTGGWLFRDWMMNQFGNLVLIEGEPTISYPAKWKPQPVAEQLFQVIEPESTAAFAPNQQVAVLPMPDEPFDLFWPEQRPTQLVDYHERSRLLTSIADGRRALLMTYSFIPQENEATRPVRAVAQDLVFELHEGEHTRMVVVTIRATEADWERIGPLAQNIWRHMGVVLP